MFSVGYLRILLSLCEKAANTMVRPPTLPKNISDISKMCEKNESDGVTPSVRPTVPIAEKASNMQVSIGRFSVMLIIVAAPIEKVTYIKRIVDALFTMQSSILLPKMFAFGLLPNTAMALA